MLKHTLQIHKLVVGRDNIHQWKIPPKNGLTTDNVVNRSIGFVVDFYIGPQVNCACFGRLKPHAVFCRMKAHIRKKGV